MKIKTAVSLMAFCILGSFFTGIFVNHYLNESKKEEPAAIVEYILDNSSAIKRMKIEEALATGLKKTQKLIVLEVDLTEDITIDESYANWDILKKMQRITVKATGKFATDLGNISAGDIIFDDFNNQIILKLLRPEIDSITINEDETIFRVVEKGIFRFGEIRLTSAEQNEIYKQAKEAMVPKLQIDMMGTAEACTKSSIIDLAVKFLSAADLGEYGVTVVWK